MGIIFYEGFCIMKGEMKVIDSDDWYQGNLIRFYVSVETY